MNHDPRDGYDTVPTTRTYKILPVDQDQYDKIVTNSDKFRTWIDQHYQLHPELFPETFENGYKLHDKNTSEKLGVTTRRIQLRNGQPWIVRPAFVMPGMTGFTEEVAKALYLRKYGVPYEGLVSIFGRDTNYWYRTDTGRATSWIVRCTVLAD